MILLRRPSPNREDTRSSRGFTLIELAVVLVVLGLVATLVAKLLPALTERFRLDQTEVGLRETNDAIDGFALANNRLPCPDANGDGLEGTAGVCGSTEIGTVPFRALGLDGQPVDEARLPLRFGVYRNAAASADLVTLTNLFEPTLPGSLTMTAGTVMNCDFTDPNLVQVVYSNPASTTLTFNGASGTFNTDDLISGAKLSYTGKVAGTLPPNPFPICPAGCPLTFNGGSNPPPVFYCACADFLVGEGIVGSTSGASGDIASVTASDLIIPFPIPGTSSFQIGETITGLVSGVTATSTAFYQPGVAMVKSVINSTTVGVSLTPRPPNFVDFLPGQRIFGSDSGASANYVSINVATSTFTVGETVVGGSSGATGTVVTDDGTTMTLSVGSGTFVVEETITGQTSGAQGTTVSVTVGVAATPTITVGVITAPSTPLAPAGDLGNRTDSNQSNELDFCQSLRNGISTAYSTGEVHTLNAAAIAINPAYLLVSGGVEDANGNAVDGSFDGLNESSTLLDFNSPAQRRNASYDDVVSTTPLHELEYRFGCGRSAAAVNALAVDSVIMQNLALAAFNANEAALVAIDSAWAALKLAEAGVALKVALLAIAIAGEASAVVELITTKGASAVAFGLATAALALAIADLVIAAVGLADAQTSYTGSCDAQLQTLGAVLPAQDAAAAALARALQADAAGGVN